MCWSLITNLCVLTHNDNTSVSLIFVAKLATNMTMKISLMILASVEDVIEIQEERGSALVELVLP